MSSPWVRLQAGALPHLEPPWEKESLSGILCPTWMLGQRNRP
ncbi:MAG TPA: hypothetical protein VMU54_24760 [Planctomycetota bacterium]|nr:hypothetical protein [Planctomycetota bacterium]